MKMKVFPAIIYSVVLIMSIACFCNGAGNGSTVSLNVDGESDEDARSTVSVPVISSPCVYWCDFNRVQDHTSAHCGSTRTSQCRPFMCDLQPDDERTKLRRKRREVTIADGVRCRCRCVDYRCNCANSTEPGCQGLPAWTCDPDTINDTEYYPPIGENEEGGVAQSPTPTSREAVIKHEEAHDYEYDRSGAEKSVVCLAAVITNCLACALMF